MINTNNAKIKFALEAVRRASRLVKLVQDEMVSPALTKDDRSPVTVADFASQALVACLLGEAYPDDPLVGEEDSRFLRQSPQTLEQVTGFVRRFIPSATPEAVCGWIDRGAGSPARRFWTLDPIDGTKGFLRGDQYAVALALVEEGAVQLGLLGCPRLGRGGTESRPFVPDYGGAGSLAVAALAQGTWCTPLDGPARFERLRVSRQADPARARLLRSFESGHTDLGKIDQLIQALGIRAEPVGMDSQVKYAVLAAGQGELLLRLLSPSQPDYREKIWDQAAGSLILEEAGGTITDLDGVPLDFTAGRTLAHNRGVLASNGLLHAAALQALRRLNA
jgi:3'(2'), 5'-bisphosphate nucleotidase